MRRTVLSAVGDVIMFSRELLSSRSYN